MPALFEHSAVVTVRGIRYTVNAAPDLVARLIAIGEHEGNLGELTGRALALVLGVDQARAFLATSPTAAEIAELNEAAGAASAGTVIAQRAPMNRAARRAAARTRTGV